MLVHIDRGYDWMEVQHSSTCSLRCIDTFGEFFSFFFFFRGWCFNGGGALIMGEGHKHFLIYYVFTK